jgi:major pilin subunit PapA
VLNKLREKVMLIKKNKLKLIAIAIGVVTSPLTVAATADTGSGVINFTGSVIEAPCGISPDSVDQTIDFGQLSKAHLDSDGISEKKDLKIELVNCTIDDAKSNTVQVTFTGGTTDASNLELATAGGTNTAIVINGYGQDVTFGTPTPAVAYQNGSNTLNFSSWVKKAIGQTTVNTGDFTAVTNFVLSYQ